MAIAYRSAGTYVSGIGNVTPGVPAGYAADDIFILFVEGDELGALSTPSGWTYITTEVGNSSQCAAYWKRSTASESAPTYTDLGDHTSAIILALSGCLATGSPIDTFSGSSATGTTVSFPTITTSVANCMIVGAVAPTATAITLATGPTNANLTTPTSPTSNTHTDGNDGGLITFYGLKATAGSVGATTGTTSATSQKSHLTIALKPALAAIGRSFGYIID